MFNSLMKKILGAILLVTSVCSISFAVLAYYQVQSSVTGQMESDGRALVTSIRRELISNNISELEQIRHIFRDIKSESKGNIAYISITDSSLNLLVTSDENNTAKEGKVDITSSATSSEGKEGKPDVISSATSAFISTANTGEKVYNVSVPFSSKLVESGNLNIGISLKGMYAELKKTLWEIIIISLLIQIIAISIGIFISRTITKPIVGIVKKLDNFSKGDFTIEFSSSTKDETRKLTNALNCSIAVLKETIGTVKNTVNNLYGISTQLTGSSNEIAITGEQISQNIEDVTNAISNQTSGIYYIVETLQSFGNKLNIMLDEANNVLASNGKIKEVTDLEYKSFQSLILTVDETKNSFNSAIEEISSLSSGINEINTITEVINSIAEQTNLLALNASIESARAGEAGKGFAVVAEEIKKLAAQVMIYSNNINKLIRNISHNTQKVVGNTKTISDKLDVEMKIIRETVTSYDNIRNEVGKVVTQIEDVSASIKDLTEEKDTIIDKVQDISEVFTQIAASTQEITSSVQNESASMQQLSAVAQELNNMANKLKEDISIFKV
ncbi:MAG: methyl-accepting chemotaxis protein [Bacillota bacterium]